MFGEVKFLSGWASDVPEGFCKLHDHVCHEVVHHPAGTGCTDIEGWGRLEFTSGMTVVYPPLSAHTQTMSEEGVDMVVHVSISNAPEVLQTPLLLADGARLLGDLEILTQPPACRTPLQQAALNYRAGTLFCNIVELAAYDTSCRDEGGGLSYAGLAFKLIHENYSNLENLASISATIGISYDYLRHVFREHYGMSMQECLIETRIERARELLRHSTLPLKAIAPLCGFGSDRHMCNVFRKQTGSSPSQLRQSKQKA